MAVVTRTESGELSFNFQYVDMLFDSLLELDIRPVVELGLMPVALASEDATVFWWKMNKSKPKDISEWYALVYATVSHFAERYGHEEVEKWYFEVWNEPNHKGFFTEYTKPKSYFEIYSAAANAVKAVSKNFRVGGPSAAGQVWVRELIEHCKETNTEIDFISTHQYCVEGAFDADGKASTKMKPVDYLVEYITKTSKVCREFGLPFLLTEWSASYSSRDPVHDSYYSAPFILETIKRCEGLLEMMSYWVYTDVFEEIAPPTQLFHGGFGLFTVRSVKKPAYHAYRFICSLHDKELNSNDSHSYVCLGDGELQILAWNHETPPVETTNKEFFGKTYETTKISDTEFEVNGLPSSHTYTVTVETVGYGMGDCKTAYLESGFGKDPTREETARLIELSQPKKCEIEVVSDECGRITFSLPATVNQVDFITVKI
jgi:xylan 1,4-beta-xylosidase